MRPKNGKSNIPREMKERLNYLFTVSSTHYATVTEKGWLSDSTGRHVLEGKTKGAPDVDTLIRLVRGMGFNPAVIFIGPYASLDMPQYIEEKQVEDRIPDSGGAERSYIHTEHLQVAEGESEYSQSAFEEWKKKVPYFYAGRVDGSSIAERLLKEQMEEDRRNGVDRMREMLSRIQEDLAVEYYDGYYVKPGTPLSEVPKPKIRKY